MIKPLVALWVLVCLVTPGLCSESWTLVFKNGKVAQITGYQVEDSFIHVTDPAGTLFTLRISDINVEKTNSMNYDPIVFSDGRSVLEAHAVKKQAAVPAHKTPDRGEDPAITLAASASPAKEPHTRAGLFESSPALSFPVVHRHIITGQSHLLVGGQLFHSGPMELTPTTVSYQEKNSLLLSALHGFHLSPKDLKQFNWSMHQHYRQYHYYVATLHFHRNTPVGEKFSFLAHEDYFKLLVRYLREFAPNCKIEMYPFGDYSPSAAR